MSLDDIPTGQPLTAREFFAALSAGAQLPASPWADEPDLEPVPDVVHRLDADLQQMLRDKREAAEREARIRDGIRAEMAHLKYDADPDAFTRPFPYLRKGVSARRGGQS